MRVAFLPLILAGLLTCQPAILAAAEEPPTAASHDLFAASGIELAGFVEIRNGWRLREDSEQKTASLAEARMLLDLSRDFSGATARIKGELGYDLIEEQEIFGLREANLLFSPVERVDLKLGRQIVTWGTGDLLFINDLFPKDWVSFFTGRDDEYLKAPTDAVKLGFFSDAANLDLVYSPSVTSSHFIDGSRLSYYNSSLGRRSGRDALLIDEEPNRLFSDFELAGRLSRNLGGTELALYFHHGFWKTPEGMNPLSGRLFYPRLNAYGASVRGNLLGGIGNLEAGWYDSKDDPTGDKPLIRNSEIRFLTGFERELGRDFTAAAQYYLEWIQDYSAYLAALPSGIPQADEYRHLLTLRLTRLLMDQNLRLSLFIFYSPSDQDGYLRPKLHYKLDDQWSLDVGGNIFSGRKDHSFFGQFETNSNLYAGLRYSF